MSTSIGLEVVVARIFISYATPDRAIADEVSSWLRAAGHEPFLDHELQDGISVGEDWEQCLYRELRQADAVIGVVTSSFVASNSCSAEIGIASALGRRLMPLRAEAGVVHPLMPRLQYADYQADPHQARDRMLQAVRRLEARGGSWREGDNSLSGAELSAEKTDLLRSRWAPGRRRRRASLIIIGLVVAMVAGIGVLLAITGDAPPTVIAPVRVGTGPGRVEVSPDGRHAYVTNYGSGTVSVIDTSSGTMTATIPVGSTPKAVAVSPNGRRAYVTNGSGTVSVIDTSGSTVTATIPVGSDPWGVAVSPDGRRTYVTNYGSGTASVIDTGNGVVIATIAVGGDPWGVAVSPDQRHAYITNYGSGTMSVIDTGDLVVTATVHVGLAPGVWQSVQTGTAPTSPAPHPILFW
jgi:YVTN family beta-propeller protein